MLHDQASQAQTLAQRLNRLASENSIMLADAEKDDSLKLVHVSERSALTTAEMRHSAQTLQETQRHLAGHHNQRHVP
jgi:hypothetical protein